MFRIVLLGGVNRFGGVALGALEGAFILCLVLYAGVSKPVPSRIKGYILGSRSAEPFIVTGKEIVDGWSALPKPGLKHEKVKSPPVSRE
jgi:membrane protein required for colicin V production